MKRICTESEKEIILSNMHQTLSGMSRSSGGSSIVKSTLISILLKSSSIILSCVITVNICLKFDCPTYVMIICIMILWKIIEAILSVFYDVKRTNKEITKFLGQNNLYVNGATIIGAYEEGIAYIEDDVKDSEGKPIIIKYPFHVTEISKEDVGKRLLIVYDENGEYQLLKINDNLISMIPDYSADYPLRFNPEEYLHIMHPNMLMIERGPRQITEYERNTYADMYVKIACSSLFLVLKVCYIVICSCVLLSCILLRLEPTGISLMKSMPIAVLGCGGMGLIIALMYQNRKKLFKTQAQFKSINEAVFQAYDIGNVDDGNTGSVRVYEWINGRPELYQYPVGCVDPKTKPGEIVYKFINSNGDIIMMNKK